MGHYVPLFILSHLSHFNQTADPTTLSYTYDDLYRLTNASSTLATTTDFLRTYTYDALGNIQNKSDQGNYLYEGNTGTRYENPHAVTDINGTNYTYDNNGNLTSDSTWTYTWNYNNKLIEADNGSADITYGYDHSGSRVLYSDGTTTTVYANIYYNTDGTNRTKHIYAGDMLVATVEYDGATTTTHYIHTDHLTGTAVVTDENGDLEQLMDYYPFGEVRINSQETSFDEQRKFTGHEYDTDTDLTYMGSRYYPDNIGRFFSQDPLYISTGFNLEDPQSLNSYAYARNNPLRYNDPNGKTFIDMVKGWFVGGARYVSDALGNSASFLSNPLGHIQQSASMTGEITQSASAFVSDMAENPQQTISETIEGVSININELENMSDLEKGKMGGYTSTGLAAGLATGKFFGDLGATYDVHGNCLNCSRLNTGYTLRNKSTGEVMKYGETINPETRYPQKYLNKNNLEFTSEVTGSKQEIHTWQHDQILDYKQAYGQRPELNKSDW